MTLVLRHSSPLKPEFIRQAIAAFALLCVTGAVRANASVPPPIITSTAPTNLQPGVGNSVTVIGANFVAGSIVLVNGTAVPSTLVNHENIIAQISLPANATGSLSLQVQNPAPGGTSGGFTEGIAAGVNLLAAARILDQTTFGPTDTLLTHVERIGITGWLNEQFSQPPSLVAIVPNPAPAYCGVTGKNCVQSEWWNVVLNNNDQLRQRVALALGEMLVISMGKDYYPYAPPYMNILSNDAFGNWYTIMTDTTLSPAMGFYLDMLNSGKTTGAQIANENYARENLQLFNIGLSLLNQDGTLQLDSSGNPIPAYTEAQVQAFARAYTGWTFANKNGTPPTALFNPQTDYVDPMAAVESEHDESEKTLLNGTVLPAGQTAEQDLAGALTNIFNHPNVPPFISKQLIQHLVTSNPSPGYVARVAAVFTDNGQHVRGDMKAVITAILTDVEARAGDNIATTDGGHLREPFLWTSALLRGVGFVNADPDGYIFLLSNYTENMGERPYFSPSVFNFFPPNYVIPGTDDLAPEFGLENTGSIGVTRTSADHIVNDSSDTGITMDLSATSPLVVDAADPTTLVSELSRVFMHGRMPDDMRTAIINEITPITGARQRARIAVYLTVTSGAYKIEH